jgi:hypothetical protein
LEDVASSSAEEDEAEEKETKTIFSIELSLLSYKDKPKIDAKLRDRV